MRLDKNGRMLSGQSTRHINICYFFIKDSIYRENVNIIYCPTECMVVDFYETVTRSFVQKDQGYKYGNNAPELSIIYDTITSQEACWE